MKLKIPIVLGGMGYNVSTWMLAKIISMLGGLGTVSAVMAERWLIHTLQDGDPGGHIRRALSSFPFPEVGQKLLKEYFVEGGIPAGVRYRNIPFFTFENSDLLIDTEVCACFCLVYLAKEGHDGLISINFLEKIQGPIIYGAVGAVWAGVDYVTMGAGMPFQVPDILDAIALGKPVTYRVDVEGGKEKTWPLTFDPEKHFGKKLKGLKKPGFIVIVSLDTTAVIYCGRVHGQVDAVCLENWRSGGHTALARGGNLLDSTGQPIHGPRDEPEYRRIFDLGKPVIIAGAMAYPEKLEWALSLGAVAVQIGTMFSWCDESGMLEIFKSQARLQAYLGILEVFISPRDSTSRYNFKHACLPGTLSEEAVRVGRTPACGPGCLMRAYWKSDGRIGFRCPALPEAFLAQGGDPAEIEGRVCLGNGLLAVTGQGNPGEPAIMTAGTDTGFARRVMKHQVDSYSAYDAVRYMLRQQVCS